MSEEADRDIVDDRRRASFDLYTENGFSGLLRDCRSTNRRKFFGWKTVRQWHQAEHFAGALLLSSGDTAAKEKRPADLTIAGHRSISLRMFRFDTRTISRSRMLAAGSCHAIRHQCVSPWQDERLRRIG